MRVLCDAGSIKMFDEKNQGSGDQKEFLCFVDGPIDLVKGTI